MNPLPANSGITATSQFKRQLEEFCRIERISGEETRRVGKTVVERVCQAHSGNVIFSPSGCKVTVSIKLENGETAKMLIVFDELAPGCRAIRKILSARVVRRMQQEPPESPAPQEPLVQRERE